MELVAAARFPPPDLDRVLEDIVTELPSERAEAAGETAPGRAASETLPGESPGNREILRSPWTGLIRQG